MHIKDVLKYCEEHGRKYSKVTIYNMGRKYGFTFPKKTCGGRISVEFDQDKFLQWFYRNFEVPPEGYMTAKELSERFGVYIADTYVFLRKYDCGIVKIGPSRRIYADPERFGKAVQEHRQKREYDWKR